MRLSSSQVVCSVDCVVKTVRVIEQSANSREIIGTLLWDDKEL